ncbi:MAG: hypothetical protein WCS77_06345 [Elusimicrobiaceae bacterium]
MLSELEPQMLDEVRDLNLKLFRKSLPLESFLKLEKVTHSHRCRLDSGFLYFSFKGPDGNFISSWRAEEAKHPKASLNFLFAILLSKLAEFTMAYSGKPANLLPVKLPDMQKGMDKSYHDKLAGLGKAYQVTKADVAGAITEEAKETASAELTRIEKGINRETARYYGLTKRETKLLKTVMQYG